MAARDLVGMQFGRWTVIERANVDGVARWLCRCKCGTERVVAAKNLVSGASTSCGCYTKERVKEARVVDYTGKRFGKLQVLEKADPGTKGATRWKCKCDCGKECIVLASSLRTGKRTSCGCDSKKGKHTMKDVTGQRFAMLTALYPTEERSRYGSVMWHCRCDCGNEIDVPLNRLRYSEQISCGCMAHKRYEEVHEKHTQVAGTSIDMIRSEKLRADNTTGVKGVFKSRGKFWSIITFQQKDYYLGSYATLEEAAQVRKEAELVLHKPAVQHYEKWMQMAAEDPEWARENPIEIHVEKSISGEFRVVLLPKI